MRENELREEKKRQASATTSEGSTSYVYQSGDTVHGKLDASKIQGNRVETTYGDPLVRTTPFHLLPASLKNALGGEYTWASWLQHPLWPSLLPQSV